MTDTEENEEEKRFWIEPWIDCEFVKVNRKLTLLIKCKCTMGNKGKRNNVRIRRACKATDMDHRVLQDLHQQCLK